jgi:hypothetical protein
MTSFVSSSNEYDDVEACNDEEAARMNGAAASNDIGGAGTVHVASAPQSTVNVTTDSVALCIPLPFGIVPTSNLG